MKRLLNFALGVAIVDGGFVIGVQIMNFLLAFFLSGYITREIDAITLLISFISMLNLATIIYRVAGIAKGVKYSPLLCYQHALRRLPFLAMLYMLIGLAFFFLPIDRKILAPLILCMLPYGIIACVFVVVLNKDPFRAIYATISSLKKRNNLLQFSLLSILYTLPFLLRSKIADATMTQYVELFGSVWFLFCHILTIVFFVDSVDTTANQIRSGDKKTKVIII